jgi:hypothetical protein
MAGLGNLGLDVLKSASEIRRAGIYLKTDLTLLAINKATTTFKI